MKKVLVTGGLGFIGSSVVDVLIRNNYDVAIYDDLSTGSIIDAYPGCIVFTNRVEDANSLDLAMSIFKPEFIIHLAAQISVEKSVNNIVDDALTNIIGTVNIIKLARIHGVKKIVFASSAAVYGKSDILPIPVSYEGQPLSPYGASKKTAENYLKVAKELYGIDYVILRYSNVYGPRQTSNGEGGVVSIFMDRLIRNKQVTIYGDGFQTRDFIYVEDVAKANLKALQYGKSGVFNISSTTSTSILELMGLIQEICMDTLPPVFGHERNGDIKNSVLCNQSSIDSLSWTPEHSLKQGLLKTYHFYLSEKMASVNV
ncbi:NAD-dependent epimerase/dehydratase family protein [Ureibacillus acetophenoni]|uniref:UDP-glucose 4-epimerase n=1 Tax=Ureibacillus acetophenoni TaxID=614649 RepID=A0A285U9F1_9BACL|nr:NAD-dependent epimerase/dehydratase family protein [Ureibacillus acetophenoni]SOC38462.1 UDP-glucose 4-epimerase [Ureibacillus acetophenoni]